MRVGGWRQALAALPPGKRPSTNCTGNCVLTGAENLAPTRIQSPGHRGEGDSLHTSCVVIFHIFSVFIKFNVTVRMVSNTLGLQYDLHQFVVIRKEKEGRAFPLTSAHMLTFHADGLIWHMVKIHGKSRWQLFKVLKKRAMINVMFYKTDVSDTWCRQQQGVIVVIK
jgi:hypothetical protein